jgi:ABC-type transport system involved in multi-copper enzyme maturation permease subunit
MVRVPVVAPRFDASVTRSQFLHELLFEAKYVLKSVPFLVLLCFGMLNLFASSFVIEDFYGTKVLPTTAMMLLVIQGSYSFLLVFIVAFYAGELIWRERSTRLSDVIDALPVPNWVPLLAKTAALALVIVAFMLAGVLLCVAIQLARGYTSIEVSLYLSDVLIQSCPFILWAVAAIVLQTISSNKFIGYFLFIVLFIVGIVLPAVHLEHHLYNFASAPNVQYSDMNGYGHFLKGWSWFQLYWAEIAGGLLVIADSVFWSGPRDGSLDLLQHQYREHVYGFRRRVGCPSPLRKSVPTP